MSKKYDFNYIIIGSGPAGSAAALTLAKAKKSVALVEGHFFGGSNLNTRDVPFGVALDFAHHFNKLASYPELQNQELSFNLPTVAARELSTVIEAGGNNKEAFESTGVICLNGYANFLDNHTIAINQKKFTAENFIIATGSHLKTAGITGAESIGFLTPEAAIKTRHLPKVVAVIGGGASGCEITSYFASLGVQTILLEMSERLLPREDQEVGATIADYFTRKLGVTVLLNSKVTALETDELSERVIFRYENAEKMVRVDTIVLATGSEPNLDLGLENAGVKYTNNGITVDKLLQTSAKNIYAAGDCLGQESSTDRANFEGLNLAVNLINRTKTPFNYQGIIRHVETCPEVAVVGLNEDDLTRRDRKYKKSLVKLSEIPASKIYHFDYGFVKLLTDKSDHLLGASIVAPHANLMAPELSLALRHGLTITEIACTPHPINDFGYAIKLAAKNLLSKKR